MMWISFGCFLAFSLLQSNFHAAFASISPGFHERVGSNATSSGFIEKTSNYSVSDGSRGNLTYRDSKVQEYIIWPFTKLSSVAGSTLENDLHVLAQISGNVYASRTRRRKVVFFVANLSSDAADQAAKHWMVQDMYPHRTLGTVNSIEVNHTETSIPTYTEQLHPLASELRVISQPYGFGGIMRFTDYVARTDASQPTYIYHVEAGINQNHADFADLDIEWLYPDLTKHRGFDYPGEMMLEDLSGRTPYGHSTATASKAIGRIFGTNRNAATKLVVVKMSGFGEGAMSEVFRTVWDHIHRKRRQRQSVVTVSWGWWLDGHIDPLSPRFTMTRGWLEMHHWIGEMTAAGVIIVISSGNSALHYNPVLRQYREYVDQAPAVFGSLHVGRLPVLAVGGSHFDGRRWPPSQKTPETYGLQVHAPASHVICAGTQPGVHVQLSGTSFAAAEVAGVIASFLATNQFDARASVPDKLHFIRDQVSYPRVVGGPPVIWNLVDAAHNPPVDIHSALNISALGNGSTKVNQAKIPLVFNSSATQ